MSTGKNTPRRGPGSLRVLSKFKKWYWEDESKSGMNADIDVPPDWVGVPEGEHTVRGFHIPKNRDQPVLGQYREHNGWLIRSTPFIQTDSGYGCYNVLANNTYGESFTLETHWVKSSSVEMCDVLLPSVLPLYMSWLNKTELYYRILRGECL